MTYAITKGNVGNVFQMDASTGQISLRPGMPPIDHEDPSTDGVYDLQIEAVDDGVPPQRVSSSVEITVTDVNEIPTVSRSLRQVRENQPMETLVGAFISASDPDDATVPFGTLTYKLVDMCPNAIEGVCVFQGADGNGFTYGEAKQYCEDKGGALATKAVADKAFAAGIVFRGELDRER